MVAVLVSSGVDVASGASDRVRGSLAPSIPTFPLPAPGHDFCPPIWLYLQNDKKRKTHANFSPTDRTHTRQDKASGSTSLIHIRQVSVRGNDTAIVVPQDRHKNRWDGYPGILQTEYQPFVNIGWVVHIITSRNRAPGATDAENDRKVGETSSAVIDTNEDTLVRSRRE